MNEILELHRIAGAAIFGLAGSMPGATAQRQGESVFAISGEPNASLNPLLIGPEADPADVARAAIDLARQRGCSALLFVHPEAAPALRGASEALGIVPAGEVPLMVLRPDATLSLETTLDVVRGVTPELRRSAVELVAESFELPFDSAFRMLGNEPKEPDLFELYVALQNKAAVSTVTVVPHGATASIWNMATPPARQHQGFGRIVLSTAIEAMRARGAQRFLLFASPAGQPLYRKLGFEALCSYGLWITQPA